MSQATEGRQKTFQASAALSKYRRVRLSSGKLAYAGAADTDAVGTLTRDVLAADEYVTVDLANAEGTQIMVAHAAFSAYAAVYAAADGRVDDAGTVLVGITLEAATAQDDHVEVLTSPATTIATFARSTFTQDDLQEYALPPEAWRTWDALATNLPGTAAADDLALVTGTAGTDAPKIQSGDAGGTTVTQKAGINYTVPIEYVDGQTITLRANTAMQVVSDTTATIDFSVYRQAAPTVDLCATAAQSINSATPADKDFTITPTNVVAGDILNIVMTVAITDAGDAAPNIQALIHKTSMLLDVKG